MRQYVKLRHLKMLRKIMTSNININNNSKSIAEGSANKDSNENETTFPMKI